MTQKTDTNLVHIIRDSTSPRYEELELSEDLFDKVIKRLHESLYTSHSFLGGPVKANILIDTLSESYPEDLVHKAIEEVLEEEERKPSHVLATRETKLVEYFVSLYERVRGIDKLTLEGEFEFGTIWTYNCHKDKHKEIRDNIRAGVKTRKDTLIVTLDYIDIIHYNSDGCYIKKREKPLLKFEVKERKKGYEITAARRGKIRWPRYSLRDALLEYTELSSKIKRENSCLNRVHAFVAAFGGIERYTTILVDEAIADLKGSMY